MRAFAAGLKRVYKPRYIGYILLHTISRVDLKGGDGMARKTLVYYLIAVMFIIGIAPRVDAAFLPSETIGITGAQRDADIQRIQAVLEMKLVRQRLLDLGFSPEEIATRVSEMTDEQVHSFAQKLDDLRVGKDSGLGIVIAVLIIVLLVILIINLTTGKKVVVTQ